METVYPCAASALTRGRRARRPRPRSRHRTVPVTFAEIKEVDEESEEACMVAPTPDRERRRPDVLDDQLVRFAEFRRRRARRERDVLRERTEEPAPGTVQRDDDATTNAAAFSSATPRAGSEPAVLSLVDT
ncbi:unnamed protein product [Diatraea saccharalis]|uniref:Uncharacterized protein n=1 Tax=Diatraea saccharalis TaxID=40085 RepID=A0A9N9N3N8_9NEOP|nr:unnamed protein product [Diatraea saccharalis]